MLNSYKHFCMHLSWSPGSKIRHSGGQGGHLFTSSSPVVEMRRAISEEGSHYPASGMRLEADPVLLE